MSISSAEVQQSRETQLAQGKDLSQRMVKLEGWWVAPYPFPDTLHAGNVRLSRQKQPTLKGGGRVEEVIAISKGGS